MELRVSRPLATQYAFGDLLSSSAASTREADLGAARRFAGRMVARGGSRPERPVNAGDVAAMGLIHEIMHRTVGRARGRVRPLLPEALDDLAKQLGQLRSDVLRAPSKRAFRVLPCTLRAPIRWHTWMAPPTAGPIGRLPWRSCCCSG